MMIWRGLAFWSVLVFSTELQAEELRLRLHGSNTVGAALAPAMVEQWAAQQSFVGMRRRQLGDLEVVLIATHADGRTLRVDIHSHGTSTGFADLKVGATDLWMASRPVSRYEVEQARSMGRLDHPEQEHVVGLDGLAIVVAPTNSVVGLRIDQLRDIYTGRIVNWSQLGLPAGVIRVYARDQHSGTWDTFQSLVLAGAELRPDARRYESNAVLTKLVANDPQAIGFSGLAAVGPAKVVAIGSKATPPLLPNPQSVGTEDYLLARRLYLYHADDLSELGQTLVEFAQSEHGQRVAERVGYVPQRIVAMPSTASVDAPSDYLSLVDGAQRLSLNFRFGTGLSLLDSKAERDIQRLIDFMGKEENQGRRVRLAGFADQSEGAAFFSLSLSNDRVDYVATRLAKAGLRPQMARGFGGAVPVAPETSPLGQLKNRRVEVWLY